MTELGYDPFDPERSLYPTTAKGWAVLISIGAVLAVLTTFVAIPLWNPGAQFTPGMSIFTVVVMWIFSTFLLAGALLRCKIDLIEAKKREEQRQQRLTEAHASK